MSILLVMIPLTILVCALGVVAFFWAVDNEQFEDMESPSQLPLEDAVDE